MVTIFHSLVMSRIDFCNSLYNHVPRYLLRRLQSVINRAGWIIFSLSSWNAFFIVVALASCDSKNSI